MDPRTSLSLSTSCKFCKGENLLEEIKDSLNTIKGYFFPSYKGLEKINIGKMRRNKMGLILK